MHLTIRGKVMTGALLIASGYGVGLTMPNDAAPSAPACTYYAAEPMSQLSVEPYESLDDTGLVKYAVYDDAPRPIGYVTATAANAMRAALVLEEARSARRQRRDRE